MEYTVVTLTYEDDTKKINVMSVDTKDVADVVIPATMSINGTDIPVAEITRDAFCDNATITSVTIPETMETVSSGAFSDCPNLEKVTILNAEASVLKSGNPFQNIAEDAVLVVPDNMKSTYASTEGFDAVKTVSEVSVFEKDGLQYRYSFNDGTVKVIGTTSDAEKLTIPAEVEYNGVSCPVTTIDKDAFKDDENLKQISLPASISEIGANAFAGCTNLVKITLESETAPALGENAFDEATLSTIEVRVPDDAKESYSNNENWSKFENLLGASDPISIKNVADGKIEDLKVVVNATAETTGEEGDADDRKTVTIVSGLPVENGQLVIPSTVVIGGEEYTVTVIAEGAFKDNKEIKEVVIPASIEKIGDEAFAGCDNIVKIESQSATPAQLGENVFSETTLKNAEVRVSDEAAAAYKADEDWSKFENLMAAGDSYSPVAEGISNLKVEFVEDNTENGENGEGSENRTKSVVIVSAEPTEDGRLVIPSEVEICGVTYPVTAIAEGAFKDNKEIKEVVIPASIGKIGDEAFAGCDNIARIESQSATPAQLGENVFSETTLKNAEVRVSDEALETYQKAEGWSDFKSILKVSEVRIESLTLAATEMTVKVGDSFKIEVTINPETATNKDLLWSSSDTEILSVASDGNITALKAGTATITVNTLDGSELKAECKVTVANDHESDVAPEEGENTDNEGDKEDSNTEEPNAEEPNAEEPNAEEPNAEQPENMEGDVNNGTDPQDGESENGESENDDNDGIDPQGIDNEDETTSGIDTANANSKMRCSKMGDTLIVEGLPEGAIIEVYSMKGQLFYRGTDNHIEGLTPDIYIIRSGNQTVKFAK